MIIAYMGQNVKAYLTHYLKYLESIELRCPCCGGETIGHGSYERHVHISDTIEYIPIQRVKCNDCNKTHAVIPDFISPRKHYSACDIELAVNDLEDGLKPEQIESEASIQTVRRWWAEYKDKLKQAAGALRSLLFRVFDKAVNELSMMGVKGLTLLERVLSAFPPIESSNLIMGEANLWLASHWISEIL
ncbi:MAG: hypothetical protein HPY66_0349 [Firmicutes bacterium]|nr:hypothetical protein [Bacillota bacterium]